MFEILMYLFENYMDSSVALNADQDTVVSELEQAGFKRHEIGRALEWLDGLHRMQEILQSGHALTPQAMRHYSEDELVSLSFEAKSFLLYLEQLNILDPATREIVIDRIQALDVGEIDIGRVKWVVLIALFNQPEKKAALSLLQDMILSDALDVLH